jgi:protein-L-isoaspartate(D-aspartate) O-methyltransferase
VNDQRRADPYAAMRQHMVEYQLRDRGLRDERVLAAMERVPRHEFVPAGQLGEAYEDRPLPIGLGQTISQPYIVALMVGLLRVQPGHRILEIGAGSGYQAAVIAQIAARVVGVELVPQLATRAAATLARLGYDNVRIIAGDGTLGFPEEAPYDGIVVAAAAPEIPPPLLEQLAEGGRLVAPVGTRTMQTCVVGVKDQGVLRLEEGIDCVFVPLLGEHGWGR